MLLVFFSCSKENTPDTVEIPFTLEKDYLLIEATVNGTKGKFLFDTGSNSSCFGNVKNLYPVGFSNTQWVGRKEFRLMYRLNKITFGDTVVKTKSAVSARPDLVKNLKDNGWDGLLGCMIFEGYWVEISYSKRKIILHKEKPDYFSNHSPVVIPNKDDPHFCIPITIDDKIFYLSIDTGLNCAFLFPGGVISGRNSNEYREIVSNERVEQYHLVKTNEIKILDETYTDISIMTNSYFAPNAISQKQSIISFDDVGLLGNTFLKYYDVLLDCRELRKGKTTGMYYEPNTPLAERNYGFFSYIKNVPEFGILNFSITESGIRIRSILKDSIAYNACGLRPGAVITRINGEPINKYFRHELLEPSFYLTVDNFTILEDGIERTVESPVKSRVYEVPTAD
ncbi:MAG: hypothetical protein LBN21_06475 [Treponema sp.]|nr:hypothetical protein [Treponema sp.]